MLVGGGKNDVQRNVESLTLAMFSRKQVMQFRHLDVNDTLNNSIKMLERLVGEHVQIELRPQASIPAIYADASMSGEEHPFGGFPG